jgi:hypothetical protein
VHKREASASRNAFKCEKSVAKQNLNYGRANTPLFYASYIRSPYLSSATAMNAALAPLEETLACMVHCFCVWISKVSSCSVGAWRGQGVISLPLPPFFRFWGHFLSGRVRFARCRCDATITYHISQRERLALVMVPWPVGAVSHPLQQGQFWGRSLALGPCLSGFRIATLPCWWAVRRADSIQAARNERHGDSAYTQADKSFPKSLIIVRLLFFWRSKTRNLSGPTKDLYGILFVLPVVARRSRRGRASGRHTASQPATS